MIASLHEKLRRKCEVYKTLHFRNLPWLDYEVKNYALSLKFRTRVLCWVRNPYRLKQLSL